MPRNPKGRPAKIQQQLKFPESEKPITRTSDILPRTLTIHLDKIHLGSCLAREESLALYAVTRVSLDIHKHSCPARFSIDDGKKPANQIGMAAWERPNLNHHATYKYRPKRIENSAECIALATLRALDDLKVIQRSEELTGADWVVGPTLGDLESAFRVEVSGIDDAQTSPSVINGRVSKKSDQLKKGQRRVPDVMDGISIVVALKQGTVSIERVNLTRKSARVRN